MRTFKLKFLLGGAVILLTVMACNFQINGTNPPPDATETLTQVPPTSTFTTAPVSLPVIASPSLQSLDMQDVNNGWALTGTGVVRTTDGGVTWYDATPSGLSGEPTAPFFLDSSTGWVLSGSGMATSGTLYHTTDGGVSWTSVPVPFGGGSLYFVDPMNGWELVGLGAAMSHESVAVFRTSDGGTTWTQAFTNDPGVSGSSDSLPLVGDKNGIAATDANHAWVTGAEPVTDFIYIYATQDGGQNWVLQNPSLPAAYAGAMTNAFPPSFFSATEGVLPVGLYTDSQATVFYLSHDGGQTWSASTPIASNGVISLASPTDFFVWDGGPILYASHDSGANWAAVTTNINVQDNLVAFQFVNAATGWVISTDASNHRTLYKTTDGGATWGIIQP